MLWGWSCRPKLDWRSSIVKVVKSSLSGRCSQMARNIWEDEMGRAKRLLGDSLGSLMTKWCQERMFVIVCRFKKKHCSKCVYVCLCVLLWIFSWQVLCRPRISPISDWSSLVMTTVTDNTQTLPRSPLPTYTHSSCRLTWCLLAEFRIARALPRVLSNLHGKWHIDYVTLVLPPGEKKERS